MTGFDVPSLATLYLDKPLKAHTLMQAIARANRVYEEKENGLIVDYCGILKNLREALATFATRTTPDGKEVNVDPIKPEVELLEELDEAIDETRKFLSDRKFMLQDVVEKRDFPRIAAINSAKEVINQSEETRKNFELLAREVFRKFKSCITIPGVQAYRDEYGAIDIIYKKLQDDREKADIASVVKELQAIVDKAIQPNTVAEVGDRTFDISKIDFDKLKEEFNKYKRKNTLTYELKMQIEKRLQAMILRNPLRVDLYKRYQEIIAQYNLEKDRVTIEETFAALLRFVDQLDREDKRAMREGLDEETLALFDLLEKPNISPRERNILKRVAKELLEKLKNEQLKVFDWREREATRASVRSFIHDFLWNESTGLPADTYTPNEVEVKAELVFNHVYRQYVDSWNSVYQSRVYANPDFRN